MRTTNRYNKHVAGGALLLASVLALSACGQDPSGGGTDKAASPKASDCAKGSLNTSGSSAQANAVTEWVKAYQSSCDGATINYQPNGSGAGIEQFLQGSTGFAGSDSALEPAEAKKAQERCEGNKAINLPMVVGPVAVVYKLEGVDDLQLSPSTMAKIFAGKVKKWNDPAIKAENPDAKLPATPIQAVHRSDESGTTDNFTDYLSNAAPKDWTYGADKVWKAPGGQGAKGSDGIASSLKNTEGAISYVEMSYAENSELQQAKVKNGAGEYVSLTGESAAATVDSAKIVGKGNDLALEIDYTTKAKGAYPIVLVTYEITCEEGLSKEQVDLVKGFLSYTSSQKGQDKLSEIGYAPLPDELAGKVRESVKSIS
ncbi:MAG: phosphate ABC transporter substrate-binding protein PstS [Streptosporangiales bacterium]|nr:phosphate ABC transporter substrate-binding protein PstS [Streptosporangiales bacterium]